MFDLPQQKFVQFLATVSQPLFLVNSKLRLATSSLLFNDFSLNVEGVNFCAKSCSLTLYEFFNRQDSSAIETEKNKRFYSKHTAGSPI